MVPLGVQFAASATVGEQVGCGNIPVAKKHAITSVLFSVIVMTVIMVCIKIKEDAVASLFTQDPTDIMYIKEVLDLIAAYIILDAIHGVNTGLVRGLGKQFKASVATLCCYYAVGMPLALILGFKMDMGVRGFWLAFTIAISLQDIIVTAIIVFTDWYAVAKATTTDEATQM